MSARQYILPIAHKLIVDLFAGGGGASTGIERALGRHVDIAVNHNPDAISMHEANHPQARHFLSDVWEVDPIEVVDGMPVGLLHLSPDCTHHSQARGGQPRSKKIRALAWVAHRWIGKLRKRGLGPDLATLENVEQMLQWSPLIAKRCAKTGRVVRLDGTVAPKGERTPLEQQFLIPDPKRKGKTWEHFVAGLRRMGGQVQWRKIIAANHGANTTRERLFMVARFDGLPIVWPEPTHAKVPKKGQKRWGSAAECINFSLDCPSIFTRQRPLADATLKRIAKGIKKYVLEAAEPFIVPLRGTSPAHTSSHSAQAPLSTVCAGGTHHGLVAPTVMPLTHQGSDRVNDITEPLRTVTGANRGELAVVTPMLIQAGHGEGKPDAPRWSHGTNDIQGPIGTITASGGGQALASAVLVGVGGRAGQTEPRSAAEPAFTTTGKADAAIAAATLVQFRFNQTGKDIEAPLPTITAGGSAGGRAAGAAHALGLIECTLSEADEAGALRVAAFLMRYYGEGGQDNDLRDPAATITTKDRLALVTVHIKGTPYVIVDIGLRMLQPAELYRAQGFPADYIIDRGHDGRKFTKSAQVKMCGNSVSPPPMEALIRANYSDAMAAQKAAA